MKVVLQRVSSARVVVDGETTGAVGKGLLLLLGVLRGDGEADVARLAERVARYRVFRDDEGRMNLSALDLGAGMLVVSQFTLAADGRKGRRPSFERAAPPEIAQPLYERFVDHLRGLGLECATGRFGALMRVELVNDGPVTFVLEEPHPAPRP
ncbi:MAG: D-tyrosyl-tRNA(Tyr) deacylase [Planctomycetes bacterium]|nr:D-tyrosyl-tRNA(Tyr) deacylase [Planctomycetota bacterium]MDP6410364.1 D-aminoacyl-tRNA deacylase [Planctomycetota bacterium]